MQSILKYAELGPSLRFESVALEGGFECRIPLSQKIHNHLCISNMNQVSSRGCSRAYILCVLLRGLHYVRKLRVKSQPVSFPFPAFEIECWLEKAKEDCSDVEFQRMYGGTDFSPSDVSTFWTSASHFYTW